MFLRLAVSMGCLLGACALAQGSPGAVVGGTETEGDPEVVALQWRSLECDQVAPVRCSGLLIAPRAVLTAAHCVQEEIPEAVQVFSGSDVAGPGEVVFATEVLVHPDWDPEARVHDLALVVLPSPSALEPVPLHDGAAPVAVGEGVRLVGFGSDGADGLPGVKRTGTATVSEVAAHTFTIVPAPSMSCLADSGGPVLVERGGREVVAGVTSWGDEGCVEFGVNGRVDAALDGFLQPALDSVADLPEASFVEQVELAGSEVCDVACQADADCPSGMECTERSDGLRCRYQGLQAGWFDGSACDDPGCDGLCVGLEDAGAPACTCYQACPPVEVPEDEARSCGCVSGGVGGTGAWLLLALAVGRRRLE